jgi:hypothetical protein
MMIDHHVRHHTRRQRAVAEPGLRIHQHDCVVAREQRIIPRHRIELGEFRELLVQPAADAALERDFHVCAGDALLKQRAHRDAAGQRVRIGVLMRRDEDFLLVAEQFQQLLRPRASARTPSDGGGGAGHGLGAGFDERRLGHWNLPAPL